MVDGSAADASLADLISRLVRLAARFGGEADIDAALVIADRDQPGSADELCRLADSARANGTDAVGALELYRRAASVFAARQALDGVARASWGAAESTVRLERWNDALSWAARSGEAARMEDDTDWVVRALQVAANAACGIGDSLRAERPADAVELYSFAAASCGATSDEPGAGRACFGLAASLGNCDRTMESLRAFTRSAQHLGEDPSWLFAIATESLDVTRRARSAGEVMAAAALHALLLRAAEDQGEPMTATTAAVGLAIVATEVDRERSLSLALESVGRVGSGRAAVIEALAAHLDNNGMGDGATRLVERALASARGDDSAQLHLWLGCHLRAGRSYDKAAGHFRSAAALASGVQAEGLVELAAESEVEHLLRDEPRVAITGDIARQMLSSAQERATGETGHDRGTALRRAADIAAAIPDYDEAVRLATEAIVIAEGDGCASCTFRGYETLGDVHHGHNNIAGTRAAWESALASAGGQFDAEVVELLCRLGASYLTTGQVREAEDRLQAALRKATASDGMRLAALKAHSLYADLMSNVGRFDEAARHVSEALTLDEALGRPGIDRAGLLVDAAFIELARRRLADALQLANQAVASATASIDSSNPYSLPAAQYARAKVYFQQGALVLAQHDLHCAIGRARISDYIGIEEAASQLLGEILILVGDDDGFGWLVAAARLRTMLRARTPDPDVRFRLARTQARKLDGSLALAERRKRPDAAAMMLEIDRVFATSEALRAGLRPEVREAIDELLAARPSPSVRKEPRGGEPTARSSSDTAHAAKVSRVEHLIGHAFTHLVDPEPDPGWMVGGNWDWLLTFHLLLNGEGEDGRLQIDSVCVDAEGNVDMQRMKAGDTARSILEEFAGTGAAGDVPKRDSESVPQCLRRSIPAEAWGAVAQLLFPPRLRQALLTAFRAGQVLRLQVCPSGPLWGLPWPALPIGGGARLIDAACISLSPNAATASELAERGAQRAPRTAILRNEAISGSEEVVSSFDDGLVCTDLADLSRRLGSSGFGTIVLLAHGDAAPGLLQSLDFGSFPLGAAQLMALPLPLDVRIAACSSGASVWLPGLEPLGLVFAAHLGGARWVTTCAWPVPQTALTGVMTRMARSSEPPPAALRTAQLDFLRDKPSARLWEWATLAVHGG